MTLMGLDLNSSRARAVCGAAGLPRPMALDGTERELPLAISLERRRPEVGRAGLQLCRRLPHLVCLDFLAHLGEPRQWKAGRHRLDAAKAIALVLERLDPACAGVRGLALTLPSYLTRIQAGQLATLLGKRRLPLLGSVSAPLAVAWSAHAQQPWRGLALVLDVDEHALTWTAVAADEAGALGQLRVLADKRFPQLSLRAWKECLLDGIADRSIQQSRRDPRDSAVAEQTLYEQLDEACDLSRQRQMLELVIQAEHWYQNLILAPAEFPAFCAALVRKTVQGLNAVLTAAQAEGLPSVVFVSAAASRLPGLLRGVQQYTGAGTRVLSLPADSAAKAAHELAAHWQSGAFPTGHADQALPLTRRSPLQIPQAPKATLRDGNTKLPPRVPKVVQADDDFSVAIDE
jgi:hypothetical protein